MIDEAYLPFARSKSFVAELERFEHLVVLRTLSKVGLAGLRIGYLAAAEAIANEIEKIRLPYNVGTLNQEAAIFILEHFDVLQEQIDNILADRERLTHRLRDLGLQVFPSQANFLLVKVLDFVWLLKVFCIPILKSTKYWLKIFMVSIHCCINAYVFLWVCQKTMICSWS